MLSVVEKLSQRCITPEAKRAIAEFFRFLATITHKERLALDNVVGSWYGAVIDQDPLMSASEKGEDFEMAAKLLERLAQSNGHGTKALEPLAIAGSAVVSAPVVPETKLLFVPEQSKLQEAADAKREAIRQQLIRNKTVRPSRINEIRTWLLTLPKCSEVEYDTVVRMWYKDHPDHAGSAFNQLCVLDKALKKISHARYQLVRGATKKLLKKLKFFDGKKYHPEKTMFD